MVMQVHLTLLKCVNLVLHNTVEKAPAKGSVLNMAVFVDQNHSHRASHFKATQQAMKDIRNRD